MRNSSLLIDFPIGRYGAATLLPIGWNGRPFRVSSGNRAYNRGDSSGCVPEHDRKNGVSRRLISLS